MRCSSYVNRPVRLITTTRVYILNCQALKALESVCPQPESGTRLVHKPQRWAPGSAGICKAANPLYDTLC